MTSSVTEGTESVSLNVVLLIICFLSVLFNLIVIVIIASKPEFRGKTEAFILNMSVSDIMLAGIAVPIKLVQSLSEGSDFSGGDGACKLMMLLPTMTIMTSIYTMMVISFDRYFSIVRNRRIPRWGIVVALVAIWVVSLAFASPTIYEYSVYLEYEEDDNETEVYCGSHGIEEDFETIYASIIVVIAYFLPLLVIVVNYTQISRFLWKAGNRVGDSTMVDGAVSKHKIRITKMLALITAVFAMCWAPYFVIFTIEEVTGTDDSQSFGSWPHTVKIVFIVLSSISNPILYIAFNKKFRTAFVKLFTGASACSVTSGQLEMNSTQPSTARS